MQRDPGREVIPHRQGEDNQPGDDRQNAEIGMKHEAHEHEHGNPGHVAERDQSGAGHKFADYVDVAKGLRPSPPTGERAVEHALEHRTAHLAVEFDAGPNEDLGAHRFEN